MNQFKIHKRIEEFLKQDTKVASVEDAKELVSVNADAKNYFFAKVDEKWLEWLWNNGFLDVFKEQPADTTQYRFVTPEINYFREVANKKPEIAVKIILDDELATTEKKFRPELIDCILYICSEMKSEYLVKVVEKIRNEHWVKLLSRYSYWGSQYEKMFEILYVAKEYDALLILANAVLATRKKEEVQGKSIILPDGTRIPTHNDDKPFYLDDVPQTKVFEYLTKLLDTKYVEKTFELLLNTLSNIASLGDDSDKNSLFGKDDTFYLFDVNLFTLEPSENISRSYRDTAKELVTTIKIATNKLIGDSCASGNSTSVHNIFNTYVGMFDDSKAKLPNTRAMWRLRLYILSLCPDVFKEELKKSFEILFTVNNYYEVLSGAEYEMTLQKTFSVFTDNEKREYIENVIELFVRKNKEKANQSWHLKHGSRIFTVIKDDPITKELSKQILDAGFKFIDEYKPEAIISDIKGGVHTVVSRAPITQEEFNKLSVEELIKKLKTVWTPEELVKKNTEQDDDYNPINADGIGELIKNSITKDFNKFVSKATLFFDSENIHPHYVGALLKGMQDNIKNNINADFSNLVELMVKLKKAGANNELSDKKEEMGLYDTWLSDWRSIFHAVTDVLQELLGNRNGQMALKNFQEKYRYNIFSIIEYLLLYPDPKNELKKTGVVEDGDIYENEVGDPYLTAINSVRGRAFQALVFFVFVDSKDFKEEEEVKIKPDIEELYENTLKQEKTRALMFMYGHYLPTFYYRHKKWIRGLLPNIFSKEDKYLSLAATEGYLAQTLYKDIFEDSAFQELYKDWINLKDTKYPHQNHFKDVDESLATHLALAFLHFDLPIDSDLLKAFWENENETRHKEFISFIGRSVLSNKSDDKKAEKDVVDSKKLLGFWDWALEHITNEKVLAEFGYWINPDVEVLDDKEAIVRFAKTVEKSNGQIEWEYGFLSRIDSFAEIDPENTFKLINVYLLDKEGNINQHNGVFVRDDNKLISALKIIRSKDGMQEKITSLINTLLEKDTMRQFWSYKVLLRDDENK